MQLNYQYLPPNLKNPVHQAPVLTPQPNHNTHRYQPSDTGLVPSLPTSTPTISASEHGHGHGQSHIYQSHDNPPPEPSNKIWNETGELGEQQPSEGMLPHGRVIPNDNLSRADQASNVASLSAAFLPPENKTMIPKHNPPIRNTSFWPSLPQPYSEQIAKVSEAPPSAVQRLDSRIQISPPTPPSLAFSPLENYAIPPKQYSHKNAKLFWPPAPQAYLEQIANSSEHPPAALISEKDIPAPIPSSQKFAQFPPSLPFFPLARLFGVRVGPPLYVLQYLYEDSIICHSPEEVLF